MCPTDTTPDPRDMQRVPPSQAIPEGSGQQRRVRAGSTEIAQRPPLPDHPRQLAADVEDEEADPVVDTGPGIADGAEGRR